MLKSLSNLKVIANYMEQAKGISQETWDDMNYKEREDYLKKHPKSSYAKKQSSLEKRLAKLEPQDNRYMEEPYFFDPKEVKDIVNKIGSFDDIDFLLKNNKDKFTDWCMNKYGCDYNTSLEVWDKLPPY